MSHVADAYNNPFAHAGDDSPPTRSALAVLGLERTDVTDERVDVVLKRALERLERHPDDVSAYGRSLTVEHLKEAAKALKDPKSLIVSELLDFPFHPFDASNVEGLDELVLEFRKRVSRYCRPDLANAAVLGELLSPLMGDAPRVESASLEVEPPTLDCTEEILRSLV